MPEPDADKSLFDRNREAIDKSERKGNVGHVPEDRNLHNHDERKKMHDHENDPANKDT